MCRASTTGWPVSAAAHKAVDLEMPTNDDLTRRVGRAVDGNGLKNRTRFTAGRGFESLTRRLKIDFLKERADNQRVSYGSVTRRKSCCSSEGRLSPP